MKETVFYRPIDLAKEYLKGSSILAHESEQKLPIEVAALLHLAKNPPPGKKHIFKEYLGLRLYFIFQRFCEKYRKDIEKNYSKEVFFRILRTLIFFSLADLPVKFIDVEFIRNNNRLETTYKRKLDGAIKNVDSLLKEPACMLTPEESMTLEGIKTRMQEWKAYQPEVIELTPLLEARLNCYYIFSSTETQEEWVNYISRYTFKRAKGKPKNLMFNALLVTVFLLLEKDSISIKERQNLTADIINHSFLADPSLTRKKQITAKDIDNAIHA